MLNLISKSTILALAYVAGTSAFAKEYSYTTNATPVSFSDIQTQIRTDYSEPDFVFDNTVDLNFTSTLNASQSTLNGFGSLTLKSLTINAASRMWLNAANDSYVKIGTFTHTQATQEWGSRMYGGHWEFDSINIVSDGTNVQNGIALGEATTGSLQSLKVNGNVTGRISQLRVSNVATATYVASRWDTADVDVKGKFSSLSNWSIYNYTQNENGHLYYKFGAIDQSRSMTTSTRSTSSTVFTTINIMFTGNQSTVDGGVANLSGEIVRGLGAGAINYMNLAFFMNSSDGKLVQKLSGQRVNFNSGATVTSGTLLVNFKETSNVNHGNLTMEGGKFGSTNTAGGAFLFTDLVYSGGTIALAVNSTDKLVDTLKLSGTAKLADGSSAKVAFDFGSDLAWLVDNTDNDGKGVKVISWGEKNLEADSFIANAYATLENSYNANFTSTDDGLYVKYVAVPEPATVAAIFGALALALAAYRRRK